MQLIMRKDKLWAIIRQLRLQAIIREESKKQS